MTDTFLSLLTSISGAEMKIIVALIITLASCALAEELNSGLARDHDHIQNDAGREVRGGLCGDNLVWEFSSETLTISGTGDMACTNQTYSPWGNQMIRTKHIIIQSGVTSIGPFAFMGFSNLQDVKIPEGVTSIGQYAFNYCLVLGTIDIPSSVIKIEEGAFSQCWSLQYLSFPQGSSLTSIGYKALSDCRSLQSVTLPSSLTSIDSSAFDSCYELHSVVYRGSANPAQNPSSSFDRLSEASFVCVPKSYSSRSFCGLTTFCKHESCESFLHNQCFEPVCEASNTITMIKRKNATEWENRTNGCVDYKCFIDNGAVFWRKCNSTEKIKRVCEEDQCKVVEGDKEKETITIEIEVEGLDAANFNASEVQIVLSNLTNIEADKLRIQAEINDKNQVVRVVVVVEDQNTAEVISEAVNEIKPEESEGVARHFKEARIVVIDRAISCSVKAEGTVLMAMIPLIAFLITVMNK